MPDAGRKRESRSQDEDALTGTVNAASSDRLAEHAGIARLSEELLPALIAKLSTTALGELEVRQGAWHVRLRRPYGVGPGEGRRSTDRPSRAQPGHETHGHGRAAVESHRAGRAGAGSAGVPATATGVTAGTGAASASNNGAGAMRPGALGGQADGASDRSRSIATSPAVGVFNPGPRAASGTKVRAGDSLGSVDVLGVPQEVRAPADGIVGSMLVEAGMAVEYGQELFRLELTEPAEAR